MSRQALEEEGFSDYAYVDVPGAPKRFDARPFAAILVPFTVLRLKYPEVREGVKKFSDWPTIPQLYVFMPQIMNINEYHESHVLFSCRNAEFVGGCDIVGI